MLPLEQQVVNLELSKKIEELGVKQESLFVWEYYNENCYGVRYRPYAVVPDFYNQYKLFSAFTASELLEMLPGSLMLQEKCTRLFLCKSNNKFNVKYDTGYNEYYDWVWDENICNALAKMLIYLIEENIISCS